MFKIREIICSMCFGVGIVKTKINMYEVNDIVCTQCKGTKGEEGMCVIEVLVPDRDSKEGKHSIEDSRSIVYDIGGTLYKDVN